MTPRRERGEVVEAVAVGEDVVELLVRLPRLAAAVLPGQFAQIACGPGPLPLLRRPFSVAWTEGDACAFVLAPVGVGTRLLAALRPGDELDVIGPLGRPFTLAAPPGPVVCVSGGLGCAPFPLLARALRRGGAPRVVVLSGASTSARLYPPERFSRGDGGVAVVEATDDGSRGRAGPVTELVPSALAAARDAAVPCALYACGPTPMLAALATLLEGSAGPPLSEASLEVAMGCGIGTCLGCAVPVADGDRRRWALCCTDGPAMAIAGVDWRALTALPRPGRG